MGWTSRSVCEAEQSVDRWSAEFQVARSGLGSRSGLSEYYQSLSELDTSSGAAVVIGNVQRPSDLRCRHRAVTNTTLSSGHSPVCSAEARYAISCIIWPVVSLPPSLSSAVTLQENYSHRQPQLTKLALVMQPARLGCCSAASTQDASQGNRLEDRL